MKRIEEFEGGLRVVSRSRRDVSGEFGVIPLVAGAYR